LQLPNVGRPATEHDEREVKDSAPLIA